MNWTKQIEINRIFDVNGVSCYAHLSTKENCILCSVALAHGF